jgi:hypothetical protein
LHATFLDAAVPTLPWPHVLLRLLVAALLGGAIGMERELRERQAGLRTHLVVCVGAALFTLVSAYGFEDFFAATGTRTDPTRIAAQIVSGIGFLGAGAIIATLGALLTLGPLRIVAYRATRRWRAETERLLVELPAGGSPVPVIEVVERFGHVLSLDVSQEGDRREMGIDVQLHGETSPRVVAAVADLDGVLEVRWME